MNSLTRGIILLMKSAITGESYELPEDFNLEQAYPILKEHSIRSIGYLGARNCGISNQSAVMQQLFSVYLKSIQTSERQLAAVKKIYDALDAEKIDYMPVKGCNMKRRYPYPEMRTMGDADILIRMEQYDRIRSIMMGAGFEESMESDHELVWTSRDLYVELHKRLVPTYSKDFYSYYGDGWKLATRWEGTHFYMSPEDEYIYIFTHMAKHYRYGGVGFRQLLDLWVLCRVYPEMNTDYIAGEMKKLRLEEFYRNICKTLDVWFADATEDSLTEMITTYVLNSGNWGSMVKHELSNAVRDIENADTVQNSRKNYILEAIFPSVERISTAYPIVAKYPIILPFAWVWKWGEILLTRPQKIKYKLFATKMLSKENVSDFQQSLHAVGLDFRFDDIE